jgi:hypothetical protein
MLFSFSSRAAAYALTAGLLALPVTLAAPSFARAASKPLPPKLVKAPTKSSPAKSPATTKKASGLTDVELADWTALQVGYVKTYSPLVRVPLALDNKQRSCAVAQLRAELKPTQTAQLRTSHYPDSAVAAMVAKASVSCGFATNAVFLHLEKGEPLLLNSVKLCFSDEFSRWPRLADHVATELMNVSLSDDSAVSLLADQQRINAKCITPEQQKLIAQRVSTTFEKISNTLPQ